MIKRAIIMALAGISFSHVTHASDAPVAINPFDGEERRLAPIPVANIPLPALPAVASPPAQEAFYDKNRGIFDSLHIAIKTEDRAILVTSESNEQQGQGVKNWLVRNGDEIVVNGRKIKVSFVGDAIYLADADGNIAMITGIEAPSATAQSINQVAPITHDSQNIPLSAGANIGTGAGSTTIGVGAGSAMRGGPIPAGMR